jgi:hypothetical protein
VGEEIKGNGSTIAVHTDQINRIEKLLNDLIKKVDDGRIDNARNEERWQNHLKDHVTDGRINSDEHNTIKAVIAVVGGLLVTLIGSLVVMMYTHVLTADKAKVLWDALVSMGRF